MSDLTLHMLDYKAQMNDAITSVTAEQLEGAVYLLEEAYNDDRTVFFCGNGGSLALADHFVCDYMKGISYDTDRPFRAISLTSTPVLSAIGNDMGFDNIFSYQLTNLGRAEDVLVVISSSGNSKNVINALHEAYTRNIRTIALVGFDGGFIKRNDLAETIIHVKSDNYGIVEDTHSFILHAMAQYLRKKYSNNPNMKL